MRFYLLENVQRWSNGGNSVKYLAIRKFEFAGNAGGPGSGRYARGLIGISVATVARVISRSMFAAVAGGSDFRDRLARGHIPPTLTLSTPAFYPAQLRPDTRLFSSRFANPCEASRGGRINELPVRHIGYREFSGILYLFCV